MSFFNETIFHAEEAVFRAVTGSTYNIPNAYGEIVRGSSFPKVGTIPEAVVREGTFKAEGKAVRGTNTLFTKLIQGSYLYDGNVVRQIDYVVSDNLLFLKEAFPSNVSVDTPVRVCERQFYKMVYAKNTHLSDSPTFQEALIRPSDVHVSGGAPVAFDATSGEISFELHR